VPAGHGGADRHRAPALALTTRRVAQDSGQLHPAVTLTSHSVPHGPVFQLKFQDCQGAAAPIAGEFNCYVLDASDPFSNKLTNVTCSASLP
jgi:hypothetical protein